MNRLQLIAQAAKRVQSDKGVKVNGLYRQAIMLSDLEYTTSKKDVDNRTELDFNN